MLIFGRYLRLMHSPRGTMRILRRTLLSKRFAMEDEWAARHRTLDALSLGGDYEWIAAVQKKFVGGGIASAVDVDVAVCAAEEKDQLTDLVDLVYRLRHTENTADTLPSTEYALLRTILKHNATDLLFKVITDPINYGVFFNEHSACLAIDYLLERHNHAGAAKIASIIMQQEMFDSKLLNMLCIYAALRWLELSPDERVFDTIVQPVAATEENVNEEDIRMFKFPYLKNAYFDSHFDLEKAEHLVGKTLLWMVEHTALENSLAHSIRTVGALFYEKYELFTELLQDGQILPAAVDVCRIEVERKAADVEEELKKNYEKFTEQLGKCSLSNSMTSLSSEVREHLRKVQSDEEDKVVDAQKSLLKEWDDRRSALIKAQAEYLNCRLRLEEIQKQCEELEAKREMVYFFENRMKWEDQAKRKDEIFDELRERERDEELSEEEYSVSIFEKIRLSKSASS
uniref:tRNA-t(6)A37 methylthiotransferase n=1 Tax=Parascaris univalens TaxID=6257 RepID=A0A915B3E8_PARUN